MGITILLIKKYFTENVQAIIGMPLILAEIYLLGRFALPRLIGKKSIAYAILEKILRNH